MKRDWKQWTKAAVIRAIKTIAQTAIATVGVAATMQDVNWLVVGSTALLAGILSVLTSVAGLPEIKDQYCCLTIENGIAIVQKAAPNLCTPTNITLSRKNP